MLIVVNLTTTAKSVSERPLVAIEWEATLHTRVPNVETQEGGLTGCSTIVERASPAAAKKTYAAEAVISKTWQLAEANWDMELKKI